MRRSGSFEISTALVEVEPPSMPMKPSITSPCLKSVGMNLWWRYFSMNASRSVLALREAAVGALLGFLLIAADVDVPLETLIAGYLPDVRRLRSCRTR